MDQFLDPETDANRQFLDPETDKNFQFLDKNLLDPETDVMEQFLGPETDIKHQFLDPETDIKRQFLVDHPETDIMDQFLDPETDIMGERTYILFLDLRTSLCLTAAINTSSTPSPVLAEASTYYTASIFSVISLPSLVVTSPLAPHQHKVHQGRGESAQATI